MFHITGSFSLFFFVGFFPSKPIRPSSYLSCTCGLYLSVSNAETEGGESPSSVI